jgi:hypothetical protein
MADEFSCQRKNSVKFGGNSKGGVLQYAYPAMVLDADEIQKPHTKLQLCNRSQKINTARRAFSPAREHEGCAPRSTPETHKTDSNKNRSPRHPPPDTHKDR